MEGYIECHYPEQVKALKDDKVAFNDKFKSAVRRHNAGFALRKAAEESSNGKR